MQKSNKIKVTLFVDQTDAAQMAAFIALCSVMGELPQQVEEQKETPVVPLAAPAPKKRTRRTAAQIKKDKELATAEPEAQAEPEAEQPKTPPAKKAPAKKAPAKKAPAKKETAPAPKKEEETPQETNFSVMDIRKAMQPKVKGHRPALKEKLTELGASSVTTLAPQHYAEFYEFLESLED